MVLRAWVGIAATATPPTQVCPKPSVGLQSQGIDSGPRDGVGIMHNSSERPAPTPVGLMTRQEVRAMLGLMNAILKECAEDRS